MSAKVVSTVCLLLMFVALSYAVRCHNCFDCGTSSGPTIDCGIISNSVNCYLAKIPSGRVSRSCGIPLLDRIRLPYGCISIGGTTICKCIGNGCNNYRNIRG